MDIPVQLLTSTNDAKVSWIETEQKLSGDCMVEGGGFEPPKSSDDRFTVCSLWPLGNPSKVETIACKLELAMGLEPATC